MIQSIKLTQVKRQQGFTLIELIMVIVILGILSAFALPKFADFSSEAEKSTTEGARGAVKSSSAIAHAQYLAKGNTGSSVDLEGISVVMVNGYPSADDGEVNICAAAGLDSSDYTCETTTTTAPKVMTITLQGSTCNFTYTEAATSTAPAISTINNCP